MKSWTFVILRNSYLTILRRSRFRGEVDEESMNRMLSAPAGQDHSLHLSDVQRGLLELPESQREALILVGAGGFSYEEAAEICGCAVGTVKSRVARARVALRSEEHTSELQSLMRIWYAVFCLKKKREQTGTQYN